ncbi:MAG: cupin domain-containing protein [Syntrophales bacterium]|jgi:quercetin dioxygenase-like cupin family protein|nr:cupin domain-containing protein [Syntrophales bacterium]MCK9528195.1 cupin domain-containing protein [Syntrophales bacterium]MDX9921342.1 cupin domain-containing protein [Syntrophales bacterium]
MFTRGSRKGYREMLPGIELKPMTHGNAMLLGEFRLKKGSRIPSHRHVYEQIGYLVSGGMRFILEDGIFDAEPGDSWCITADCEHAAEVMEDSVVVEVFSPVREDYLF